MIIQQGLLQYLPQPDSHKSQRTGFPWDVETPSDKYQNFTSFPKITIITPSYNQGQFLEETIRSILLQNYPNLEFIIVDGGSTDNSVEVIKKYEKWITHWVSEKDKGTYDAINKGLEKMTGDYWCVVNSDDILLLGGIFNVVNAIINKTEKTHWITGGGYCYNTNSELIRKLSTSYANDADVINTKVFAGYNFLGYSCILHASTFLSKEVYEKVGGFANMHAMDTEYWLRMEINKFKCQVIPDYVSGLRYHEGAKTVYKQYDVLAELRENVVHLEDRYNIKLTEQQKKEIKQFLSYWDLEVLTAGIYQFGVSKNKAKQISLLIENLVKYPNNLFNRRVLGLVKRVFTGISKSDYNPEFR